MARFPFPIPFGWYQVAFPEEIAPGEVQPLRYFGRDLVLWRDDAGAAHLQDAICPHLGAHIGYGGSVKAGNIVCPFHGWEFDAAGACADIPYSDRVNRKARLHTYPLVERNGFVLAWYHPFAAPPAWEIPVIEGVGDPAFSDYITSEFTVRSALQEMAENTVDLAHFQYVHGTDEVAVVEAYELDGPFNTMLSVQKYVTPKGVVDGRIDVHGYGPGFSTTHFSGIIDALLVATSTPIDDETAQVRFNFTVRRKPDGSVPRLAELFVAMINQQMNEDIPIWEHKQHLVVPALADTDGPIMTFRRFYSQFYAEGDHIHAAPDPVASPN